ncbi:hypothetical protein GW916_07325, partial [bacterium]|nr:hypothetical protein [bacterium]
MFPNNRLNKFAWGLAFAMLLVFAINSMAFADGTDNPTPCEFQPPAADRSPTMSNILTSQVSEAWLAVDNTYPGLHRWNTNQWPGVDYISPTTVAFKNGGVFSFVGVDGAGGGYSVMIDGIGVCEGWRQFI